MSPPLKKKKNVSFNINRKETKKNNIFYPY